MRNKLILLTGYEALKNKGCDLELVLEFDCNLEELLLLSFEELKFPETIEGLENFYEFLRYEACIYTDEELENESDYQLEVKRGKYNLVTF